MAAHTIRKVSREGIGYSTVDLGDVRHVFAAAVPRLSPQKKTTWPKKSSRNPFPEMLYRCTDTLRRNASPH